MKSINGIVKISRKEIAKVQGKTQEQRIMAFLQHCVDSYEKTCAAALNDMVKRIKGEDYENR